MAKAYANRVWMTTATAGTGTITLGSAKAGYLTFAEGGVANAEKVTYVLVDGNDFEIGLGTYTSSGTTMSRDTVTVSKISGTAGTTKLTLSGSAEVFLAPAAADMIFKDENGNIGINTVPWTGLYPPPITIYGKPVSGGATYNAMTLSGYTTADMTNKGGVMTSARYDNSHAPFTIFSGFDYGPGTGRGLFYGGGGWNLPDAMYHLFYTAPTYTETVDTGVSAFSIWENGNVGVNTGDASSFSDAKFKVQLNDDGATAGPVMALFRNSASPAASDVIGQVNFQGRDSAANVQDYALINGVITDPTSTTEDGELVFSNTIAGVLTETLRLSGSKHTSSANISVSKTAANAEFEVNANSGYERAFAFRTAGSNRWLFAASTGAESGSNAGSDLAYYRYSDAGGFLGTALLIERATGNITSEAQDLNLSWTDAGASSGPNFNIFRDSSSPAASDVIGQLKFTGRDSAANVQEYAAINGVITDPTSTTEDADLVFRVVAAGTLTERMRLTSEGALMAPQPEKAEVGTTYTLAASDSGKIVTLSNGSAITLTVPTNASVPIPVGTRIDIAQWGAGQVSITSSATIRSEGSKLKLRGQYAVATLWKRATDEWLLAGDIVA